MLCRNVSVSIGNDTNLPVFRYSKSEHGKSGTGTILQIIGTHSDTYIDAKVR